jgi:hypothetical protein
VLWERIVQDGKKVRKRRKIFSIYFSSFRNNVRPRHRWPAKWRKWAAFAWGFFGSPRPDGERASPALPFGSRLTEKRSLSTLVDTELTLAAKAERIGFANGFVAQGPAIAQMTVW